MPALLVAESPPLYGEVRVHGAKNSVLPILAATLLCRTPCVLHNCPDILDVKHTLAILRVLGCVCQRDGQSLYIDTRGRASAVIPPALAGSMRASSLFLGALLSADGEATLTLPGGCPIGHRPMDYHQFAFEALGARTEQTDGSIRCRAARLHSARICLPGRSVGATENALLAALGADGVSTIENAACEPEIVDLAGFLRACGAHIHGAGTPTITVRGGEALHGATYTILPDRIEAASYLCACAACGGTLTLRRVCAAQLEPVLTALRQSGCELCGADDTLTLRRSGPLRVCEPVTALPYPGFPTDAMPLLQAALLRARGQTSFTETIFENRFLHVAQLRKLGAALRLDGQTLHLRGVPRLHGATLHAKDLRGAAALLVAALCAEGESTIFGVKHMERGYDNLKTTLQSVGARLKTVEIPIKV